MNKRTLFIVQFTLGLVVALTGAAFMFFGIFETSVRIIIGIIGLGLIAMSNIWNLPPRK